MYLSPSALQKLGHPDGELHCIRAAKEQGVLFVAPTFASCSMQQMTHEARVVGQVIHAHSVIACPITWRFSVHLHDYFCMWHQTLFFQLYVNSNRATSEEVVRGAEAAGCKALVISVDSPQLSRHERDVIKKDQQGGSAATAATASSLVDPTLCWDDIQWFKSITKMDIILKGLGNAEDVVLAKRHGVKGVVLSNGAGQLDSSRSGIEVLPEAMAALKEEFSAEDLEGDPCKCTPIICTVRVCQWSEEVIYVLCRFSCVRGGWDPAWI